MSRGELFPRAFQQLEDKTLEFREIVERAYVVNPKATHADLVHTGYWAMAAQLKIDYEVGRLK